MQYIQLDNFNGTLNIICKDDGSGEHLVFDSLEEAENTLDENCQDGVVIPLNTNITQLLQSCWSFISAAKAEYHEAIKLSEDLEEILQFK